MYRCVLILILAVTCLTGIARGEECTRKSYEGLVSEAKNADANRLWSDSVSLYRRILDECPGQLVEGDRPKLYDALAVGLLMQAQYGEAIDTAKKCIELDGRYNACMMTAAKAYESLGDRAMAEQFAREAIEVGGSDDYSAAVVIYAKDFLKKLGQK
jgi:tetratricopeptide (TPR) repeat protein